MNVSFVNDDPLNSDVVDSATGQLLYDITTPFTLGTSKTTVRDAQGQIVAVYKHGWGTDKMTFLGETRDIDEWLPTRDFFSSARTFVGPNGKEYVWKQRSMSRSFKLVDAATGAHVAETHSATLGILEPMRYMRIDMSSEVAPFLDTIVLSFIICEKKRRDRRRRRRAAN